MNSFEHHWANTADDNIPENKLKQAKIFLQPVISELTQPNQSGVRVLDAGCGDGVHLKVIYKQFANSVHIHCTAVDIANSAIRKVKSSFPESFLTAKVADIQDLDGPNDYYDLVISYGVVAYTEDPKWAISELIRVLKPGGVLALWIYPVDGLLKKSAFQCARSVCRALGDRWTSILCHGLVPIMPLLPISSKISLRNSSWKACHEVLMVNLNPRHLGMLKQEIIDQWLNEGGLVLNDKIAAIPGAFYARK